MPWTPDQMKMFATKNSLGKLSDDKFDKIRGEYHSKGGKRKPLRKLKRKKTMRKARRRKM
jgi:hypothetical protein